MRFPSRSFWGFMGIAALGVVVLSSTDYPVIDDIALNERARALFAVAPPAVTPPPGGRTDVGLGAATALAQGGGAASPHAVTHAARFDRYLEGDRNSLDAQEKQGLRLFIETGCVACHRGVDVGGGLVRVAAEEPPGEAVVMPASLRNVATSAPYFHDDEVNDLERAVSIMGARRLGRLLLDRTSAAIAAFLQSLTSPEPVPGAGSARQVRADYAVGAPVEMTQR